MNIQPIGIINTPESWDQLEDWIEAHSPEDRAHLWTAAGMAWNLAAELTKGEESKPPRRKTYPAYLPGYRYGDPVTAYKENGVWYAGGDRAPYGTAIKLDGGVYELRGAILKFQDYDF